MKQLPNGDVEFYGSFGRSMIFVMLFITIPVYSFLIFVALVWHTIDALFFVVVTMMLGFVFGISYLSVRNTKFPPSFVVHADSLEYRNKYGLHFLSLQKFIGFTTTSKNLLNIQMLIFITKDFNKKYTPCLLGLLDPQEKASLIDVLQSKGLTYFPPGSDILKK